MLSILTVVWARHRGLRELMTEFAISESSVIRIVHGRFAGGVCAKQKKDGRDEEVDIDGRGDRNRCGFIRGGNGGLFDLEESGLRRSRKRRSRQAGRYHTRKGLSR